MDGEFMFVVEIIHMPEIVRFRLFGVTKCIY